MILFRFTLIRLLQAIPLLFGLATMMFFLSRLLPGDPTLLFLSPTISPDRLEQLRAQFNLDRPMIEQYVAWLRSAATGDWGVSFIHNEPVTRVIARFFPNTMILAAGALLFEVILGVVFAMPVFFSKNEWFKRFCSKALIVISTIPSFWTGMLLLMVFAYALRWFPSSEMFSPGTMPGEKTLTDLLHHLMLPALTAALPAAATLGRYLSENIRATEQREYVLAARAMGLRERDVFRHFVLPNAISPMVALLGVEFGLLLTGVLVTETLFAWPGMGRLTITAVEARDYPLILGCSVMAGVVVVIGNFLADVVNAAIDPRVRVAEAR